MGKRLADGVSAKLEFDYVCELGPSFDESYLHKTIGQITNAITSPQDFRIFSGYAHDALAKSEGEKSGRPREVDFYIHAYPSELTPTCIEAKWADSSHCTWDKILLDICRLALVRQHSPTTECLFILSGPTSKVNAAIKSIEENMPLRKKRGQRIGILEAPSERFAVPRHYRLKDWGGRFAGPDHLQKALPKKKNGRPNVPVKIQTALVRSSGTRTGKWQTVVWRIS